MSNSPSDLKDPVSTYIPLSSVFCGNTNRSGSGTRGDAIKSDPLSVGLFHRGLLHVLPFGENLMHRTHVIRTDGGQTNIPPETHRNNHISEEKSLMHKK